MYALFQALDEMTRKRESSLRQHSFFQLRVHLRRGIDLVARDKGGTSDPYVKFKMGGRLLYKSRTIYRDLNPVWEETFTIPVEDPFMPVHIKVFDYDWGLQDDFMGSAYLDLTKFELTNQARRSPPTRQTRRETERTRSAATRANNENTPVPLPDSNLVTIFHPTEIRTSISPSSAVKLNTTSALVNYATEAGEMMTAEVTLSLRDPGKAEYLGELQLSVTLYPRSQEDKDQVGHCRTL
uniref:C2 domain-containing protein n=1 Tax=Timema douglasi TaxID=61478 RepID=A0A7R8VM09_TIMDO|nr:unnamed protein product [Timema douglasi]